MNGNMDIEEKALDVVDFYDSGKYKSSFLVVQTLREHFKENRFSVSIVGKDLPESISHGVG